MKLKKLFFLMLFALLAIPVTWANNVYVKVTDASQLQAGKKYILAHFHESVEQFEVAGQLGNMGFSCTYYYNKASTNTFTLQTYTSENKSAVDISALTNPTLFTLGGETGAWTLNIGDNENVQYIRPDSQSGYKIITTSDVTSESQWNIIKDTSVGGFIVKNVKWPTKAILQRTSQNNFQCRPVSASYFNSYLYYYAGESNLEAPESFEIGENLTGTFTVTGENLIKNLTVTSSNEDFVVTPSTLSLNNDFSVNSQIEVTYTGTDPVASTTITIASGNVSKEVTVTATLPVSNIEVSTNALNLGAEPSASFSLSGTYLTDNISIAIKDGSDDGFSLSPTSIAHNNGTVGNTDVIVMYSGTAKNAHATITITSGDVIQEVAVTASAPDLFSTPGNYNVKNKGNNKYVVINGTTDAAASESYIDDADVITLGFNADGIVTTMNNYYGDGDLIATLETVKNVLKNKLEGNGMNADFVADMFKIKLVKTGESDGSIYFCFDIPLIGDIDNIRTFLLGQGINNQLVKDYLDLLLQPGKRVYLCADGENGTFSFTQDKTASNSKWLAIEYVQPEDVLFTTEGNYYVSNKGNNKYVVIDGTTDAAASAADKDDADIITLGFNADGVVSTMKNYDGDGDLIATLETVKNVLKNKLEGNGMNADFVADMFKIKLVKTGENDGSIYFCFDIPRIENIDNIRNYLLNEGINNQLVKDYLDILLQPGKRIYLCTADENGTFSFTRDKTASASKWLVEEYVKVEDVLFTTSGNYYVSNKGNNKFVVINGTTDAAASAAEKEDADVITLDFHEDGIVSTMKNYDGEGDLIATLETVKNVLKNKLESQNLNADFVADMFKIKLVKTGDSDGSMYFCFDIPKISNIDEIRNYLLNEGINNQLVKDYLEILLQPKKRIYLNIADDNGTFSFTRDKNSNTSKWLVEEYVKVEDVLFTTPGNYNIKNKGNKQYVVINGSTDAEVSEPEKDFADIITLGFNEDGTVNTMKNYAGEGDVMETLVTVKQVLADKIHQYDSNINTDFLEEMFKMRLVDTGDGDGSIYLCLDIPRIKDIDEIRAAIESYVNNAQVKEYLNQLLQPRRRVYMCVNSEDNKSLSFTRNNGNLSKWLVEEAEVYEDDLFTTPGNYYINNKKTGKFVRLENSQLANVTAENQAQADIITLGFNENGAISVMEQYEGDGNMIATLNMIKSSFKDALEAGGYATNFLDQMFTMKMVKTGDNDGSVYMVVDAPKVRNFDEIKEYLLEMTDNPAVTFYLSNMTAGKRHYLCVDGDDTFGFTLNNGSASKWLVNEAKITEDGDILFTTPGLYYINNKQSGKYVKLQNSALADVTAEDKDHADIIILDFNEEGAVSTMQQYDGDGDMIATLNMIKSSFKDALEAGGFETNFLDQMFTMKMVMTGDDDGSVYLAVDVPAIENFDAIRDYLLGKTDNPAVTFYLSNMTAGKRHYLCVDGDDTFGFTLDNGTASKWLVENAQINPTDDDLFTEPWYYYINNKLTGKYVRLVNSTLADVTAETEDDADIIALDFDEDGNVSVMKQYRGDGDMIATLDFIKTSFQDALEEGGYPTDFLDQMFTMRIVKTGDDDGSVYLCVDIPLIPNFNEIRDYLIEKAGGNQAVTFYLSHMTPGKRHYLCVDNDDTFGFTLDNGTASKWMVTRLEVIPIIAEYFPDPYFRQFVHAKYDKNDNWWLSQAELDAVTTIEIRASENADYAKITDLTGIEYFTSIKKFYLVGTSTNKMILDNLDLSAITTLEELYCYYGNLEEVNVSGCTNLKIIQLHNQDALTSLDLTNNTNVVEISLEDNSNFSTLDIPTPLVTLESLSIRRCDAFKNQTIDLTGDNNLYVLSLAGNVRYNLIKGVGKDMTNLRYLSVDYNTFEDDVLDLTGCQHLFELSLISCSLRELLLNGCTNLGTRQSSRPGKPEQDGTFTIHSNYLRALDLTGVTGELDETAPRNYNYNLTNKYPELLADYIKHNGYNGQITTKMKADVSLVYIDRDVTPNVYTYLLYLRMDDNKSSEKEGTFEEGLAEVGETNFKMSRVNRWVRLEGEKDLQLVSGNRLLTGKSAPTELDPDLIVGDILSLGMYTIADGEGEKEVTGKIAYLYNTKQDEQGATVVNPDEQLDSQTKIQNFYKSQTISSDGTSVIEEGDNLFPFEVEWKATISDNPTQVVTGVESVRSNAEVVGVTYYNVTGLSSERPFEGVNIVVTRYSDGTTSTAKRLF